MHDNMDTAALATRNMNTTTTDRRQAGPGAVFRVAEGHL